MFIPDPDLDFYPSSRMPDPGFKKAPNPGSATLGLRYNTVASAGRNE
jgi:hypothetical protein